MGISDGLATHSQHSRSIIKKGSSRDPMRPSTSGMSIIRQPKSIQEEGGERNQRFNFHRSMGTHLMAQPNDVGLQQDSESDFARQFERDI